MLPAASRDWSHTFLVPPAVIGTVELMALERSVTLPAALAIGPAMVSLVVASSARSPLVSTALLTVSEPAASIAMGRWEAGTASTMRSLESATLIA